MCIERETTSWKGRRGKSARWRQLSFGEKTNSGTTGSIREVSCSRLDGGEHDIRSRMNCRERRLRMKVNINATSLGYASSRERSCKYASLTCTNVQGGTGELLRILLWGWMLRCVDCWGDMGGEKLLWLTSIARWRVFGDGDLSCFGVWWKSIVSIWGGGFRFGLSWALPSLLSFIHSFIQINSNQSLQSKVITNSELSPNFDTNWCSPYITIIKTDKF